jgi:NAD(P)-dependent dehydrogenase (short-subunit alcohol dehydrogenase family)
LSSEADVGIILHVDPDPVNLETGSGSPPVALVTGAASGIGLATSVGLSERGYAVVAIDRVRPDDLCDRIKTGGGNAVPVAGDVASAHTYEAAIEAAREFGSLEVAVLNAGVRGETGDITQLTMEAYRTLLDVNVTGVYLGLRALIEAWTGRRGRVVVTASGGGLIGVAHDPVYALTKHAVVGLVRSLGLRGDLDHIRINCICPGGVDTPMLPESRRAGRELVSPEVVANSILEILGSERSGEAWVLTPSVFERFGFGTPPAF